jgi:hypothetical protein
MRRPERPLTRRTVLRSGVGLGATVGLSGLVTPTASAAASPGPTSTARGATSANGWETQTVADSGMILTRPVAGSDVTVAVRVGDVETVLMHVIRRHHYEIGTLRPGDVVGFRSPDRASTGHRTNHASGTAVDIRPGWYPTGSRTLSGHELDVIRDILADCAGVVVWGGDLTTPEESHFHIDVAPTDPLLTEVANTLRTWNDLPGRGAGVVLAGA